MCRLCWMLVLVLVVISGGMAWKFVIQGETVTATDGRQALLLAPAERDMVLAEMRAFLASVQAIVQGVQEEDMDAVVKAARHVGAAAQGAVPGSLMKKLPLEFKRLGFDTHRQFDQLALDAEQLGDPGHTLEQLAGLMRNCVACHAAYRIDAASMTRR